MASTGAARERTPQIIRQWKIVRALANGRKRDPRMFVEELGVSYQTIYRDLTALLNAGFPLIFEQVVTSDAKMSLRVSMGEDWVTKCPEQDFDEHGDILDIEDVARQLDKRKASEPFEGVVRKEAKQETPLPAVTIRNGKEVRHYQCACGHAIRIGETESYNPTCPSCVSWIKGIRSGNIV